jgi:hypothetical protein
MQPLFVHFAETGEFQIVTGGVKHIIFWKLAGSTLSPSKGVFGKARCGCMHGLCVPYIERVVRACV